MSSLTLDSPAKINLDLRILDRYPDGYHEIFTLFHRISLTDKIKLSKRAAGIRLVCTHPKVPTDERNIIVKAYHLLKHKFPKLKGVNVHLKKNIPVEAGLGGGSTNAAAFLLGMNRLYRLGLSRRQLVAMGKKLGADVPFFLWGVNQALGHGRGDRITPRPANAVTHFILIISNKGLSTKKVYQNVRLGGKEASLTNIGRIVRIACQSMDRCELEKANRLLVNDLQRPAMRLKRSIKTTIDTGVRLGAPLVKMSGSGPTVFAAFSNLKEAKACAKQLRSSVKDKVILCHSV